MEVYKIIYFLYSSFKSCVKYHGCVNAYFPSDMGLLQGGFLSSILFSVYINDIEINLIRKTVLVLIFKLSIYFSSFGFNSRIATKLTKYVR